MDVHRKTLQKQIARARETKILAIVNQQTDLMKRSDDAKQLIKFTEDVFTNGTDIEILTVVGLLLRRFDYCQKSKIMLDQKLSDFLKFLPDVRAPSTKDQHNIPLYGIITTQTAVAKYCTLNVEGMMFLRVHRIVELVFTAKDGDDRTLCHGGLTIDVTVKYNNLPTRKVETSVSDKRDGTYIISFVPDAAGVMSMTICIQGKPIKV